MLIQMKKVQGDDCGMVFCGRPLGCGLCFKVRVCSWPPNTFHRGSAAPAPKNLKTSQPPKGVTWPMTECKRETLDPVYVQDC